MNELTGRLGPPIVSLENAESLQEADLDALTRLAFRVAYGVLRHPEDAEEIAQDAMLTLCRKIQTLRHPERARQWLVRVAWRRALDRQRAERRRLRRESDIAGPGSPDTPEQVTSLEERASMVHRAIDELPEEQKKALILTSIEGEDLASVAKLMNVPTGTVKSRLFRARKTLMEKLQCLADD